MESSGGADVDAMITADASDVYLLRVNYKRSDSLLNVT